MRHVLSLAALLLTTATATLAATPPLGNGYGAIDAKRDVDPVKLAQMFCDARVHRSGMEALAPYFAPKLARLLDEHAHSHLAAAVPWQGYIYDPTGCSLEVLNNAPDTIGVLVKVTYTSPERTWSDTLNFERTPDSWLLNNVFYEDGGNLRFTLFDWLKT
jgi:hypothetical protein